jgi:hypothetical protein
MKPREVEDIYEDACRSAANRPVPDPSQAAAWKRELIAFDAADLRDGLVTWWRSNKWVPLASELRPLAEQARRSRNSRTVGRTTYARWQCSEHRSVIVGHFIEPNDYQVRCCPKQLDSGTTCAARMNEVFREDNFNTGNQTRAREEASETNAA